MNVEYNDGRQEKTYFGTMADAELAAANKRLEPEVKSVTIGPAWLPNGMTNNRANRRRYAKSVRERRWYLIEQKPSIGRIVVYNHPGSADGKFGPQQSPAIVQRVNDDETIEMAVFSVYGGFFFNHNVEQGDGPGQWNWPTRI